ncbi:MAG: hypothetical protein GC202_12655 [Alphaproteobacteria bacterium]|nr:hypothetical protein [Alphaproteobacteria bacterium]
MDLENLHREGPTPTIYPNAGRRQEVYWTGDDASRYFVLLRKAFPRILFFEDFCEAAELKPKPMVRFVEELDDLSRRFHAHAFIPYEGWKPELIRKPVVPESTRIRWTWARYLSPRLSIDLSFGGRSSCLAWRTEPESSKIEHWGSTPILTSYRRELPSERRISDKFVALARKLCIRTIPVLWESHQEFVAGKGKVSRGGLMAGDGWATPAVVNWCLEVPGRIIGFFPTASGPAHGCLPVELVPDSAWGDIRKPKWAQRG